MLKRQLQISKYFLIISLGVISLINTSCNTFLVKNGDDKVIAVVGNSKLTKTQLELATPPDMSEIDSISFSQSYIERWVRNRLLLEKAEINLSKDALNEIELMIENYETSLMVFQYQQMLIQQKLDTIVTDEDIQLYYNENSGNFKLDSNVVKAIFVKLPKSLPDGYKVRHWIRSSKEEDIITLEDYCYQNARNFDMGENWIYFNRLQKAFPRNISDQEAFLKYNRFSEATDSLYRYYVGIVDYKLVNDTTPIDFVKPQIKNIILNRRKMQFISSLENDIYQDAVNQKRFTIYAN